MTVLYPRSRIKTYENVCVLISLRILTLSKNSKGILADLGIYRALIINYLACF